MINLPFHDGRSFALYLKSEATKKGISMYKLFEMGIVNENCYYKYLSNKREPKISTAKKIILGIGNV